MYRLLVLVFCLFSTAPVWATENAVSAEMVPLTSGVQPGEAFTVAVILSMTDGWHTYWRNPGEAGMATTIDWQLPPGFQVLEKREPVPKRHKSGNITSLIHEDEAIYLFEVLPPENVADSVMLAVRVSWLECRDICRPGSADLSAILLRNQQGASVTVEQTGILQRAEKHFPVKAWQWPGTIKGRNQRVQMTLPANSSLKAPIVSAVFFPYTEMVWDISSDIKISNNRRGQILQIPLDSERQSDPDRIQGIMMLQMQSSEGTFSVNAPIDEPIL